MTPHALAIEIDDRGIAINGGLITAAVPLSTLTQMLGEPERRVLPSSPAPAGHRDAIRYVYDTLGIHALQHHHTRELVDLGLRVGTSTTGGAWQPERVYRGRLNVMGEPFAIDTDFETALENPRLLLTGTVGGFASGRIGSVFLSVYAIRLKRGSRCRVISDLTVSLEHDLWRDPAE